VVVFPYDVTVDAGGSDVVVEADIGPEDEDEPEP
jgi:hypothetical protein